MNLNIFIKLYWGVFNRVKVLIHNNSILLPALTLNYTFFLLIKHLFLIFITTVINYDVTYVTQYSFIYNPKRKGTENVIAIYNQLVKMI